MPSKEKLYLIADEIRAVASEGLLFSDSGYEKERCERMMRASARMIALLEDGAAEELPAADRLPADAASPDEDEIYTHFREDLYHISPASCVDAAVFRDGKLLLIRRRDNGLWAMPGGVVEVGETLAQAAERELLEEAGLRGKATRLLGLFDSRYWGFKSRVHFFAALFLIESADALPAIAPLEDSKSSFSETLDVGFFSEDALPPLTSGHINRAPLAFQLYRGEVETPFFDRD